MAECMCFTFMQNYKLIGFQRFPAVLIAECVDENKALLI